MNAQRAADLVVGIDFGMTCTGVAYSDLKLSTPRVLQRWPGKLLEVNNKVPTSLVYWSEGVDRGSVKGWGFKAQNVDDSKHWFKRFLDPANIVQVRETLRKRLGKEPVEGRDYPNHDEVKRWYKDYLQCVYHHLSQEIQNKTGQWVHKRVQFIFSLPCTFQKQSLMRSLLGLIKEAGFGGDGDKHTVELGLSEPEAAAVFTIGQSAIDFQAGTTILVCDAGGGTTDLAVLQTASKSDETPELEALVVAEGKNVGSTSIDVAFKRMVENRLSAVNSVVPDNAAWAMMHSPEFLVWKRAFGQDDSADLLDFPVPVPGVESDFESTQASIIGGKMRFSQKDFRDIFDPEVDKLIQLISHQIEELRQSQKDTKLNYIILSGGLGSSAYVNSRLKLKFERHTGLERLQILSSEEPQLSVVNGLVSDRVQRLNTGKAVLKSRKCPASYGVALNPPYDEKRHVGEDTYKDIDGVTYVKNQIHWLIRRGATVRTDECVLKRAHANFSPDQNSRRNRTNYYVSFNDAKHLPMNVNSADVEYLCGVDFDLTNLGLSALEELKAPKKKMLSSRPKFYRASFEVRMILGAADLRFEVWFKGKKYGDNNVTIDWG